MKPKCPTCKNKTDWKDNPHRPFCSERCKLIDLGKWASEKYRIKGRSGDETASSNNEEDA